MWNVSKTNFQQCCGVCAYIMHQIYTEVGVCVCVQAVVQEEQIRMYIHCCLTLSMVWVPSLSAINTLWDYFSKNLVRHTFLNFLIILRILVTFLACVFFGLYVLVYPQNGSFSVPWLGVSGLASVGSTPLALLEQAKRCCSPAPLNSTSHTHLYRSTNSFLIFLRMLALHLKQESGVPWRQIKGRSVSVCLSVWNGINLHNDFLLFGTWNTHEG